LDVCIYGRTVIRQRITTVNILGGRPLAPEEDQVYICLFDFLLRSFRGAFALFLSHVPRGSYCLGLVGKNRELRRRWLVYLPEGMRALHSIRLSGSFTEYLSKFKSDTRRKFRKKVERLRARGGGTLVLVRIDSEQQVEMFVRAAAKISNHSWQKRCLDLGIQATAEQISLLRGCAKRGILRSYLLRCGEAFCSFALGFQIGETYRYSQIAFDERWEEFAPGIVQLYLVLEDVSTHRPAACSISATETGNSSRCSEPITTKTRLSL